MTIDYVVPMVFPEDRQWQIDLNRVRGYREDATGEVRYRSWGTEELLVRCIHQNIPWIRTIHIILARSSQVQPWMVGAHGVHIVYHKDFMPNDVLPTFNSRAIEMYLHRIPGLSDYFLYGNDDMFPLTPMRESDFFRDGLPCLHWKMKEFNPDNAFHQACMNGLNFVAREFGQKYTEKWFHMGHNILPILKSTCNNFWEQWPEKMQASVTRFRLPQNFNQYIYSWWQILSGQYVDYEPSHHYVSTKNTCEEISEAIRTSDGLLCINDNNAVNNITNIAAMVRNEIQQRL